MSVRHSHVTLLSKVKYTGGVQNGSLDSCVSPRTCIRRRVRMCQRSLFTPSFFIFASVRAVYIGPSDAGTPFSGEMRLLDSVLRTPLPSRVDFERSLPSLFPPIRFLVHCFRRSISTSTDWSNSCSQCSQTGLFQKPLILLWSIYYITTCT